MSSPSTATNEALAQAIQRPSRKRVRFAWDNHKEMPMSMKASRGVRLHRDQAGVEALEDRDIEGPAHQYERADAEDADSRPGGNSPQQTHKA